MEHIFNYAILTAIPNARRGERVNVGMVVYLADRIDVRFSDLAKLRALTGRDWDAYAEEAKDRFTSIYSAGQAPADFNRQLTMLERIIQPSATGAFKIDSAEQYEERLGEILAALVKRPRAEAKSLSSGINKEIATEFRKTKVLATDTDSIDDHKVLRNYLVSVEDDLRADFILKNGAFHVTATLDLRRENVHIKEATWKAIVLDRAGKELPGKPNLLGVYAAQPQADQFRSHIRILEQYSSAIFNWSDPVDRRRYTRAVYDAINAPSGFGLN